MDRIRSTQTQCRKAENSLCMQKSAPEKVDKDALKVNVKINLKDVKQSNKDEEQKTSETILSCPQKRVTNSITRCIISSHKLSLSCCVLTLRGSSVPFFSALA